MEYWSCIIHNNVICGCNTCDNCMNWYGLLVGGKANQNTIGDLIFFFELHSSVLAKILLL